MVAATRAHARFGVDLSRRVEVFAAIEAADVILAFEPMRGLSGAYVAEQGAQPGIIINSQHPLARQRYTAAHELGHHLLGHGSSVDPEIDPMERWGTAREVPDHEKEAEAFAAWFLMPQALVRSVLGRLGISKPKSAADVYSIALRLGTSYEATARQLQNLRLATVAEVRDWLATQPRAIKLDRGGQVPNLRSDVWALTASESGSVVTVRPGDRIVLGFEEVPSSGYRWQLVAVPKWLHLVEDDLLPTPTVIENASAADPETNDVGAEGTHRFILDVAADAEDGLGELRLVEGQPWDPSEISNEFVVTIVVEGPRRGVREERLALSAA